MVCLSAGAILSTWLLADDKVTSPVSEKKTRSVNSEKKDALNAEKAANADLSKDADNTERNKRDRNNATLTPGDQGNTQEDIEVTRQIRRALMKDKTLSTTAKNVKIITKDGAVTLRGPVKTMAEKQAIVAKAKEVANAAHPITDEIEVKARTELESNGRASEQEVRNKP